MSRQQQLPLRDSGREPGIIIKIFLVNGESRSLRIYNWYTVTVSSALCTLQLCKYEGREFLMQLYLTI